MLALANGLVVGRGLKSSGAIMGVRTSEISEASSTSLATVTSMGMKPSSSSTTLLLSLSRKMMAKRHEEQILIFTIQIVSAHQCSPV